MTTNDTICRVIVSAMLVATAGLVALTTYLVVWPAIQERRMVKNLMAHLEKHDFGPFHDELQSFKQLRGGLGSVSALTQSLRDGEDQIRVESAKALGELGPVASDAAVSLIEALADENSDVRRLSAWALGQPHNYHLPYGNDFLTARRVGERICEVAHRRGP